MSTSTNLDQAIERDDLSEVKRLVAQGADLQELGEYDATPLANAASLGRKEIVQFLLSAGAEPDMGGCLSALGLACAKGYQEVCEMLLAAGADPSAEDTEGGTPFESAVFSGNRRIAEMLVEAGANVDPIDTYLEYARSRNAAGLHDDIIAYLQQLASK
jgi:ankyrin repeat protein